MSLMALPGPKELLSFNQTVLSYFPSRLIDKAVNPVVYRDVKPPVSPPPPPAPPSPTTRWTPDIMFYRASQQFNEWKRIAFGGTDFNELVYIALVVGVVLAADRFL